MTETDALDAYILAHSAPEGDYLYRLWLMTTVARSMPRPANSVLRLFIGQIIVCE